MVLRRSKRPVPRASESERTRPTPVDEGGAGAMDPLLHDLAADDAVLGELSEAFADERADPPARGGRTIIIGGDHDDLMSGIIADRPGSGGGPGGGGGADGGLESRPDRARDAASRNTIALGDVDDVPDAMYLDDELQRDPLGSGPVVIDDDGNSGDAVLPHHAGGGIEPRMRERRIGVRRAQSRRRLWWVALGGLVFIVIVGLLALLGSSLFAVDDVTVIGAVYTDPDELDAIIDDLSGTPVLRVDTAAFEARLEELAWVDRATVRTDFPNGAEVEIRERVPVAAMQGADGRSRVLDDEGRVIAIVDGQPVELAWFAGTGTLDVGPGQFAPPGPTAAASLVTKFSPQLADRLDYLLVTPDGADVVLVLRDDRGPIEVRFGSVIGDDVQIQKLVRLEQTLASSADRPVVVIDVSTSEVTVR